jgi:uncharacterized protein
LRALLDVSVLVALHDDNHIHHAACARWLAAHMGLGWASCPLTQNGALRVLSQPAYPHARSMAEVRRSLAGSFSSPDHDFWADDISFFDPRHVNPDRLLGHRQITDTYLLALAVHRGGRLVTLDAAIDPGAVPRATAAHLVLAARG